MRTSEDLYGENFDTKVLTTLYYPNALLRMNIWAKELVDKLNNMPLYVDSMDKRYAIRDSSRIKRVNDAIKHNYALYDQCYGKEIE